MRDKVVGKRDICLPPKIPFLEWQRPEGQTFFLQKLQIRQKSRGLSRGLTFILLSSPTNRVSTSWTTPIVLPSSLDHSSLLRNVTPPLVDAAATVMARSTSVNRLSTFCRHRRLYMLLHRHRMPSCFVGPAIRLQGALPLRLRLRRCAIQICQSLRRFVLIGFILKSALAKSLLPRHPVCTGVSSESGPLPAPLLATCYALLSGRR